MKKHSFEKSNYENSYIHNSPVPIKLKGPPQRNNPTKHLCIIVSEPFWHHICINFLQWCRLCIELSTIWDKFAVNLVLIQYQIDLLMILFGTNLDSNINTKALKSTIFKPRLSLLQCK